MRGWGGSVGAGSTWEGGGVRCARGGTTDYLPLGVVVSWGGLKVKGG